MIAKMQDNRDKHNRPFDVKQMTDGELSKEKQELQQLLLKFEDQFGRPKERLEKDIVRVIYDRYRQVKRALSQRGPSKAGNTSGSDRDKDRERDRERDQTTSSSTNNRPTRAQTTADPTGSSGTALGASMQKSKSEIKEPSNPHPDNLLNRQTKSIKHPPSMHNKIWSLHHTTSTNSDLGDFCMSESNMTGLSSSVGGSHYGSKDLLQTQSSSGHGSGAGPGPVGVSGSSLDRSRSKDSNIDHTKEFKKYDPTQLESMRERYLRDSQIYQEKMARIDRTIILLSDKKDGNNVDHSLKIKELKEEWKLMEKNLRKLGEKIGGIEGVLRR